MHKDDSINMDYSELNKDELENIKEVEEEINKKRTDPVILLAVDDKK